MKTSFTISFFYNAIALAFAASGHLTPLVAAILMPISSISVVGFFFVGGSLCGFLQNVSSMTIVVLLIAISLTVAVGFLIAFLWALRSGQYDDTYKPSVRMLFEDEGKE